VITLNAPHAEDSAPSAGRKLELSGGVVLLAAMVLAAVSPAGAVENPDSLREEVHRLQESSRRCEEALQELEARIVAAEEQAARAEAAATRPASMPPANILNPKTSLILQGRYADMREIEDRRVTGFLPGEEDHGGPRGFSLDHTELVFSASVDPYFQGFANLALAHEEAEIEEAWVQTLALGRGLVLKGGRFLSGIGYLNEQHPHAWDFADQNLAYRVLFGEHYINDGVQLKWVAPTDLYLEVAGEGGRGASHPGTDRNQRGFGSWAVLAHAGGDLGDLHSWRAGLSHLRTEASDRAGHLPDVQDVMAELRFSGESTVWIADLVWKWAPHGNPRYRNFKLQAEVFSWDEDGDLTCADNTGDGGACAGGTGRYQSDQSGWYVQGVYQFQSRWRAGYRYGRLGSGSVDFGALAAVLEHADYNPVRHTWMVDYNPSEFSRLRLQYARDRSMRGETDDQITLQYIMSLGPHGAHKF
jgi:hypothetical protein